MRIQYDKYSNRTLLKFLRETEILLDDFICHKSAEIKNKLFDDDGIPYMILHHHSGLLQPCDVGIDKSLKDRLQKFASQWRRNKHTVLTPREKMLAPKRFDVLK